MADPHPNPPPHEHPQRGRGAEDESKQRQDRGIQPQSAQDDRGLRREESGQRGTPELARVPRACRVEQAERGRQREPSHRQRDKGRGHAREKGQFRLAVCGESDHGDDCDGEQVAEDEKGGRHIIQKRFV